MNGNCIRTLCAAAVVTTAMITHSGRAAADSDSVVHVIANLINQAKCRAAHRVYKAWIKSGARISPNHRWRFDALHGLMHRGMGREMHDAGFRFAADREFREAHKHFTQSDARVRHLYDVTDVDKNMIKALVMISEIPLRVRGDRTIPENAIRLQELIADLQVHRDIVNQRLTAASGIYGANERELLAQLEYALGYAKFWTDPTNGRRDAIRHFTAALTTDTMPFLVADTSDRFGIKEDLRHNYHRASESLLRGTAVIAE